MKFQIDKQSVKSTLKYLGWTLLAIVIALLVGVLIGYAISGSGNPFKVFAPQTWQHIIDYLR